MDGRGRALDHCRCCRRLVRRSVKRRLSETLESGWVACSVRCDVGIIDDEGVDVVVCYDIGHYLLILLTIATHRPSTLLGLVLLRSTLRSSAANRTLSTALAFLRDRSLEDYLRAIIDVLFQALAQHLSVTLLLWLVVEIEHFWGLGRFPLFLRVRHSHTLRLQGLPI